MNLIARAGPGVGLSTKLTAAWVDTFQFVFARVGTVLPIG